MTRSAGGADVFARAREARAVFDLRTTHALAVSHKVAFFAFEALQSTLAQAVLAMGDLALDADIRSEEEEWVAGVCLFLGKVGLVIAIRALVGERPQAGKDGGKQQEEEEARAECGPDCLLVCALRAEDGRAPQVVNGIAELVHGGGVCRHVRDSLLVACILSQDLLPLILVLADLCLQTRVLQLLVHQVGDDD